MSLRLRLTLLFSSLTGGILFLFGVIIFILVNVLLVNQMDETLTRTVQDIIRNSRVDPVGQLNIVTLPQLDLTANVYVQVWDHDNNLHSSSPSISYLDQPLDPQGAQANQPAINETYLRGAHLRVLSVPLMVGGRSIGVIQAAANMSVIDSTWRTLLEILGITAIAAMILAAIAAWFSIGQALSPLQSVTETALQISRADDLARRIPYVGPSNDEVGQLINAFNETIERLEKLFSSQQRFLADVSHELRTPLTVIKGNVDLMRHMDCADEESLDGIEEEADRLTRLVENLLLETQAESGKLPLQFMPVELDTLVLEVYKEMHILARERVQIKVTEIDQILINGDRDRIKQVLINLISNAVNYTPKGGVIYLSLGIVGENARIIVRDTGAGIPSKDLPHIFERFYRAEKSRSRAKIGGFGLGLSIAYWIISSHGGTIEVDSQVGKGSTFCIYLPVLKGRQGEGENQEPKQELKKKGKNKQ